MEEAIKPYLPSAGGILGGVFGGPVGGFVGRVAGDVLGYLLTPSGPELLGGPGFDSGSGSIFGGTSGGGEYLGREGFGSGWDTVYNSGMDSGRLGSTSSGGGTSSGGSSSPPSSEAGTPYELPPDLLAPNEMDYFPGYDNTVAPPSNEMDYFPGYDNTVAPPPNEMDGFPGYDNTVPPPPNEMDGFPGYDNTVPPPPASEPVYVDVPVMPRTTAGEDPRTTDPVGAGAVPPGFTTGSGGWNGPAQQYTVGRTYTAAPAGYRPGFSPEHQYIAYSIAPVGDPVIDGIGMGYTNVPEAPPPLVPPLPPYTGPAMIDPETAFMPPGYARGGPVQGEGGIARLGPRQTKGPGDGMSDSIPATIDGRQRAVLSKDEFVFPADVVSDLGNGSSDAGAQILYAMVDRIRQARHGTTEQPPEIDPEAFLPA